MKEYWEKREKSLWNMIRFDKDAVEPCPTVEGLYSINKGHPEWRTYEVVLVSVRTQWLVGADEGKQRVSLTLRRPGDHNSRSFIRSTEFLHEIPNWLFDLVTRASPRDIDTPDIVAYAGRRFGE